MLELIQVSSGYGKRQVLQDLSARLEQGRLISVIGPNGCGKSTLLKTAAGLLSPFSGKLLLDGMPMTSMKRGEIAKRVAYLAQGKSTPDMTVEQMVLHGRFPHLSYPRRYTEKDRAIAHSAMETVGILDQGDAPMSSLSGGMRQNAYIAMALAQSTDYILLDEPTTYLDISHQLSLMKTLRSLADSGKGILSVMHDLPMALTFSDAVAVMGDGRLRMLDTPQEVSESGLLEELFGVSVRSDGAGGYHYFYGI